MTTQYPATRTAPQVAGCAHARWLEANEAALRKIGWYVDLTDDASIEAAPAIEPGTRICLPSDGHDFSAGSLAVIATVNADERTLTAISTGGVTVTLRWDDDFDLVDAPVGSQLNR